MARREPLKNRPENKVISTKLCFPRAKRTKEKLDWLFYGFADLLLVRAISCLFGHLTSAVVGQSNREPFKIVLGPARPALEKGESPQMKSIYDVPFSSIC